MGQKDVIAYPTSNRVGAAFGKRMAMATGMSTRLFIVFSECVNAVAQNDESRIVLLTEGAEVKFSEADIDSDVVWV